MTNQQTNDLSIVLALAPEIHATAIAKGWWPEGEQRDIGEICANIHAEISEAWEEWRNGRGETEIYYEDGAGGRIPDGATILPHYKPCGIPVELADVVIRILSAAEARGWELSPRRLYGDRSPIAFARIVAITHYKIGFATSDSGDIGSILSDALEFIAHFFDSRGMNLYATMLLKMAYNATRPHRHGGKRA